MTTSPTPSAALATQAREAYLRHVGQHLEPMAAAAHQHLLALLDQPSTISESTRRRDAWQLFGKAKGAWVTDTRKRLERLQVARAGGGTGNRGGELSLLGEETVENQILAARAALLASEKAAEVFNDLKLRIQHLEGSTELDKSDPLHAVNVTQVVVDAWLDAGLGRDHWEMCKTAIQPLLVQALVQGYKLANDLLLEHGVLREIDLRQLVRRTPGGDVPAAKGAPAVAQPGRETGAASLQAPMSTEAAAAASAAQAPAEDIPGRLMRFLTDKLPGSAKWLKGMATGGERPEPPKGPAATPGVIPPGPPAAGGPPSAAGADPSEARTRAGAFPATQVFHNPTMKMDWSTVESSAAGVRQFAKAMKAAARTDHEKAVIEVVAMIFESILAEERIPPSIRVWFARLQMPVLRTAVADPEFLSTNDHPARMLIDRMGSCVMGFDAGVSLEPLEKEIRRVVQVIEQYPETGRRVFELMYREFLKFLSTHLQNQGQVEQLANVAQQIEQKETLTVKFTIELRKQLGDAPVREAIRQFLFQVWAEVMAMAVVKYGAHHEVARGLQQTAGDLLWAASSKATRQERAQVIAKLPALLQKLRDGMTLLGYPADKQEGVIKRLSDTLAEAFMSRNAPIDQVWLGNLVNHLSDIEGFLSGSDEGEFELNAESLEMITGVDASKITVLPNTGVTAGAQALARVKTLQLGDRFFLEHNGRAVQVQLAWRSQRQHLFLFVGAAEQSYLLQRGRVASYWQAGLLRPVEAEALTVKATRDALQKLDANPERLLA